MPILEPARGSYSHGMMKIFGGFQLNGAGAPTVFRDGTNVASASKIFSVARISAGLHEITFAAGPVIPQLPFITVKLAQGATPTNHCQAQEVVGSWNPTTRKFRVLVRLTTTGAANDGDAGDRITFVIDGATTSVGQDPA